MKTHLQLLITAFCMATLFLAGEALAQTPGPSAAPKMKAIVYHEFGSPDVLRLEEVDKPVPNDNQILVKVRAVSVNPLDWHFMEGTPTSGAFRRLDSSSQRSSDSAWTTRGRWKRLGRT